MATDPKKPYGDVEYADPGYQDDNKKRYPLDSEAHCRAAWSYINMPENAEKYTPEQLASIKAKIRAALKTYGVEVEASAEPPTASTQAPAEPGASPSPAPVTAADAMRRVHAATTKTTATKAEEKGAGHMDPAKIREALGLAPDVSDDEVKTAAAAALGLAAQNSPPTPAQTPAANPALVHAAGTMTIDVSAWAEQQDRIKRLEAQAAKQQRDERDKVIAQAVSDGKFAPARKEHYVQLWDTDPELARQIIDGLTKNVIPVMAMGYSGDNDGEDIDQEYASLFPPTHNGRGR